MAANKSKNPVDIHVGNRVRTRRKMLGISQERLGDALGISFQQVQKYEKGANRIGAGRLQQIAQVLTVPVSFFFENAPGAPSDESTGSMDEQSSGSQILEFASSTEGMELNRAFVRIKKANLRKRIVALVRAVAGEGDN